MKIRTKTVYNCEHCNKLYLNFRSAEKHELSCGLNPENKRKCFSCKHFMSNSDNAFDSHNNSIGLQEAFFCKLKMEFLLPPAATHKKLKYNFESFENNPMPVNCDDYREGERQPIFFDDF